MSGATLREQRKAVASDNKVDGRNCTAELLLWITDSPSSPARSSLVPCHQGQHSFLFMSHLPLTPPAQRNHFLLQGSREISNRT